MPLSPLSSPPKPPPTTPASAGAISDPTAAAAPSAPPASPPSPTSSTSASTTAASGRPTTSAAPGSPSSTTSPPAPSAPSPSRPPTPTSIYVGSGEGLQRPDLSVGDGMYKSTDAGKTWRHLGLRDGQQIPAILVDPHNPNRLFVAVLGHPYGPNPERGVFRSTDGGQTWQKVLYKDERTGAIDLAFDPRNPQTVYAVLWQAQQGPGRTAPSPAPTAASSNPPTAAPPGTRSPTACPPSRRGPRTHRHRRRAQRPQSPVRPGRSARRSRRRLPLRRCRRQLETRQRRAAHLRPRLRFRLRPRRPQEQGRRLRRQHLHLPLRRRRPQFHRHQRRARRRRLSHHLDQSHEPRHHPAGRRSGRDHHRQRRPHLELAGTTSPPRSSITSSPTTSFPTGSTAGSRRAARSAVASRGNDGADHLPRLASRRRRGIRLHRARSAQSQHRLRRPRHASSTAPPAKSRTSRRAASYRYLRTAPLLFSPRRSARPLPGRADGPQDHRWRPELGGHQSRSSARNLRSSRQRCLLPRRRQTAVHAPRRRLLPRALRA